ncbi:MAG TPA: CRTAC1 family protein [Candidatus Wunengus sp. YC60]|uniref:CRTAC1 family protein n=1 Tax=Candidatus Wunengus sp. YC60 TaxID=3367697 RepID=UPI004026E242
MIKTEKPINKFNKRERLKKCSLFLFLFLANSFTPTMAFAQTVTTFTDVTVTASVGNTARGMGAAWGDYNNDGLLDVYVSNYKDENILYKNNGDGTFYDDTDAANVGNTDASTDIAWGDYNNDGFLDLFLVNDVAPGYGAKKVLYKNNGDGTFANVAKTAGIENTAFGMGVAWADYDNDGYLDVYVTNNAHAMICDGQPNKLFRNKKDGTFEDITDAAGVGDLGNGMGVAWCDYDNDGYQDFYVLNFDNSNFSPPENTPSILYKNNGDGTFTRVTDSAGAKNSLGGFGVAWGDYNNDGYMDVFIANLKDILASAKNVLFKNNGNGTFSDVTDTAGVGDEEESTEVTWVDYDNDGDLDLHVVNGGIGASQACVLYRNNGDETFTDVVGEASIRYVGHAEGASWGDYDNDGDMDLYLVNYGEPNVLYQNNGNDNHWIIIKPVGTISNKAGIGARIKVTTGTKTQIREVDGGSGFCSQDSLWVHFGLGSAETIDTLEIKWPGGKVQTLFNESTNKILEIKEE